MGLGLAGKVGRVAGSSHGIGKAIDFLASAQVSYITGQALVVDGGLVKWRY